MWCPHARVDTENELPRAKPISLEQYFQPPPSSRRRAIGARGQRGNPQKDLAKKKKNLKKKILQNMNSGVKCRKMFLELLFFAPILKFWLSHGSQRGKPPKDLAEMAKKGPKMAKNRPNDVKIENFSTFSNGPKWIKMAFKWSKMPPNRIFGPFGLVLGAFWPVPPSLWGHMRPK